MIMTIYERQLEIERAKQFFKDKEFAEDMEQRKSFTPAEEKAIGEAAADLHAMNMKLSKSTVSENYRRFKSCKERKSHGRYTSSGYGYEVKSFGPNTTDVHREQKSLGINQDARIFAQGIEQKLANR